MGTITPDVNKYSKLATEYSKIRAQANVLKRALLEEQQKTASLRESLRVKDTAIRRAEQEVDSLGFRNKQLEYRVGSLQDDLDKESKKSNKHSKNPNLNSTSTNSNTASKTQSNYINYNNNNADGIGTACNCVISEELQKKIIENATYISTIDDKNNEIKFNEIRIKELEKRITKLTIEHNEAIDTLRKEYNGISIRNSELERKLATTVDATSIVGSDDTLSVQSCDHTPIHNMNSMSTTISGDDRITLLEKEIFHWRTQYEILKIADTFCDFTKLRNNNININNNNNNNMNRDSSNNIKTKNKNTNNNGVITSNSSNASSGGDSGNCSTEDPITSNCSMSKEQLLINHFNKKIEELFMDKCMAESKLDSYKIECDSQQKNLECLSNKLKKIDQKFRESQRRLDDCDSQQKNLECLSNELKKIDQKFRESQRRLEISEEDLATTRKNYEEQITIMTEKVLSLTEQIAALK